MADDGLARDLSAALQRTLLFHVDATFGAELVACAPPRPPTISRVRGMADVHDVLFDQRAWQDLVGESRKRRTVFPGRLGTVARQLTDTTFNVPMASDDGGGTAISILARRRIVRDVEAAVRFIVLSRCRKATFWRLPEICDPSFVTADAAATTLSESLAPGLPLGIVQAAAGSAAFNCFGTPSINDGKCDSLSFSSYLLVRGKLLSKLLLLFQVEIIVFDGGERTRLKEDGDEKKRDGIFNSFLAGWDGNRLTGANVVFRQWT